ncbi:hypothetical protein BVC80_9101g73 [Macleaya cordata]|uniref:Nuclear transport factor 2 n=1 Tax=Macleaya cordata TaxID=56857 RepID=A0A200QGK4_MACCD|nr:hypothetical protein BVC80_9101g73 [Macleaya cordata]
MLDNSPGNLFKFYKDRSAMFCMDGVVYDGHLKILPVFTSSAFQPCIHTISKATHLPISDGSEALVTVVGSIHFRFTNNKKNFSQVCVNSMYFFCVPGPDS